MATQKPISTISYNSEKFLKEKLLDLENAHIVQYWYYIHHQGENGDKDHFHVFIYPNKRIDPMDIREMFDEYIQGETKPRRCLGFRQSKEEDWLLYCSHNPEYLVEHNSQSEDGKIIYTEMNFKHSDSIDFHNAFLRANATLANSASTYLKRVMGGASAQDLVLSGVNPFMARAIYGIYESESESALRKQVESMRIHIEDLEDELEKLRSEYDAYRNQVKKGMRGDVG